MIQNTTLILVEGGRGTEGKGIGMSTMKKGSILQKCVNTFVPHCLKAKLCYCRHVEHCVTMKLSEIKAIRVIFKLLLVGVKLT